MPGLRRRISVGAPRTQIADQPTTAPPEAQTAYKKMSLEELTDLDVNLSSVSRQSEPYGQAPAAISLTQDEIRRSGASSIPRSLAGGGHLEVPRKIPHDWGISSRPDQTAPWPNKLLVLDGWRTSNNITTRFFFPRFFGMCRIICLNIDGSKVISGSWRTLLGCEFSERRDQYHDKRRPGNTQCFMWKAGGLIRFKLFRRSGAMAARLLPMFITGSYGQVNFRNTRGTRCSPDVTTLSDSWRCHGGFSARLILISLVNGPQPLQGDVTWHSGVNVSNGRARDASGGNILAACPIPFLDDRDIIPCIRTNYENRTHLY